MQNSYMSKKNFTEIPKKNFGVIKLIAKMHEFQFIYCFL